MTIAYAFSLMSRSYAIYRGINLQLFGAFAPLPIAMIIAGGLVSGGNHCADRARSFFT